MEPFASNLNEPVSPPMQAGAVIWNAVRILLALLLWSGVGWLVAVSVPRSERLFAEFHMAVPLHTQMVTCFAHWAIPVLAVTSFFVCFKARKTWAWLWFLIVLPALLICAVFLSLYVSTMRLIDALGGPGVLHWWDCLIP